MSTNQVVNPYEYFQDFNQGRPIFNGQIFVGQVGLDPEVPANQKDVTFLDACDCPGNEVIMQPIRTSAGGVPTYNGAPIRMYVEGAYSLKVNDRNGVQVYYSPDVTKGVPLTDSTGVTTADTIALLRNIEPAQDGQQISLLGHTLAGIGGGEFYYDASDNSTLDNNGTVIVTAGGKRWKRPENGFFAVDFGVIPDGVTDSTNAALQAHEASNGDFVVYPKGEILITSRLDSGSVNIRIKGANGDFQHQLVMSAVPGVLDPLLMADLSSQSTVFKCSNTSLIGEPDTVETLGAENKLKDIRDCAIVGTNGSLIGIHFTPFKAVVTGVLVANFQWYGICTRGGATSSFENLGFDTNGYGLSEVNTPDSLEYGSGCDFKVGADKNPESYNKVNGPDRPTTFSFKDIYHTPCSGYVTEDYSGLRAMQVHGLIGSAFYRVGAYFGYYFHIVESCSLDIYVENYALNGAAAGDNSPVGIYLSQSGVAFTSYNAVSLAAGSPPFVDVVEFLGAFGYPYTMLSGKGGLSKVRGVDFSADGVVIEPTGYYGTKGDFVQRSMLKRFYNSGTNRSSTQIGVTGSYGGNGAEATTVRFEVHQDGQCDVVDGEIWSKGSRIDTRKDGNYALQLAGTGSPAAVFAAPPGSTYQRTDGVPGSLFYLKESGTDASGWVAKW